MAGYFLIYVQAVRGEYEDVCYHVMSGEREWQHIFNENTFSL